MNLHVYLMVVVNEAVYLQFALSLCLLLIVNQTVPSMYSTRDAQGKLQDCRQPIQPTQGMRIQQHILVARRASDVVPAFSLLNSLCPLGAERLATADC